MPKVPQNAVLSKLSLITPCVLSLRCAAQQRPGRSWQDLASSVTSAHAASRPTPGLRAGTTRDKWGQLRTSEDKWGQHHEGGADTGPAGASHIRWVLVTVDNIYTYFNKVRKQQHLRKLMGKLQCRVVLWHHNRWVMSWSPMLQCSPGSGWGAGSAWQTAVTSPTTRRSSATRTWSTASGG